MDGMRDQMCQRALLYRSINYKKTFKNEANCEMLHDVVYNTSEKDLERNFSCDYIYLNEPQKVRITTVVGRLHE